MKPLLVIMILCISVSCKSLKDKEIQKEAKKVDTNEVILNFKAGPETIIYKTREDYYGNVPVLLSDDGTEVVTYPHPEDVFYRGELAYPYKLSKGYLLDNRGISENVAFLDYTYEEYSKLVKAPGPDVLFSKIIDNDPLTEIYHCGNRHTFKDEIRDLNRLIDNDGLKRCNCLTRE